MVFRSKKYVGSGNLPEFFSLKKRGDQMAKPKLMTPEQVEEIRTKDYFDCIAPATIKFYSDYYIVKDSYRCCWVIKEYPPSTEELAILSQLSDKSGVTLRIFNRLVEPLEQRKIVQNAIRKNTMKSTSKIT